MRIAVVSDIHGNRTAFEAVLADLRETSPDLILHGGDLALCGSSPVDVVDQVRDLGWPGVLGNADEVLFRPESLMEFAAQTPGMDALVPTIEAMGKATRAAMGTERLAWLGALPLEYVHDALVLVHASPGNPWRAPAAAASDAELTGVYGGLRRPRVVYGHIHHSFIRTVGGLTVVNTGSVSLSNDGDPRAAYLLLDRGHPTIRRVEYAMTRELAALSSCGLPHSGWVARMLEGARPVLP